MSEWREEWWKANRANWDERVPIHASGEFYDVASFKVGAERLRLFIDHPDGVSLALCERVTKHLNHLRTEYSLEVSSPGPKYRRNKEIS